MALADGTTLKRICGQAGTVCGEPLVLPSTTQKPTSAWGRALAAASALFAHPSERYASTMSRGAGVEDGVAKLEGNVVRLDAVLAGLPAGAYSLTLRPLSGGAGAISGLNLQAPTLGSLKVVGLQPGLYEIVVTPRTDAEGASTAWVLIVEPAAYVVTQDAYEAAQTTAHGWDSDVRPQAVRSFLRAYLEAVASHLPPSAGEPSR